MLERSGASDAVSTLVQAKVKGLDDHGRARVLVEATEAARYRFDEFRSEPDPPQRPLERMTLIVARRRLRDDAERGIAEARAIAAGVNLCRDLGNRPANVCTPSYLAAQAHGLAREFDAVETNVLEEDDMRDLGMGALLAVSQGSRQPAKLITMHYRGAGDGRAPVVFVGKGVTFDTGGLSIKPAAGMDEMKYDMGGAASVFGVIRACAAMGIEANVVGVVPSAENMPDGAAYRPGDILTTMSGKTVEVINTDAEGRLLLCDALTYAERYQPDTVIDIATLTGACIVALGHHASAVLSSSDTVARQLMQAGEDSGDRCWQLPLWDEYQEQLESPFADFSHVGGAPAGTITAACFLSRFTGNFKRWGHVDIAGTAWTRGDDKGATGRPVPMLMQYLLAQHAG
ncbi:MAG: leucyl aminopeptidase [Halofilum sp. (in: g-proteobacteria)]|nr:leucyl aminopeptidase [Halofilum sp. (in: g-proteobacteria)]